MYGSLAFLLLFISTGFIFSSHSSIDFDTTIQPQTDFVLQDTSKEEDSVIVEVPAQFRGGMQAFYEYVGKSLNYPKKARKKKIQGKVVVQFVIDKNGEIIDVEVIKSLHPLLDAEAVRVIQSSPKWIPATHEGKKVKIRMTMPINFTLHS